MESGARGTLGVILKTTMRMHECSRNITTFHEVHKCICLLFLYNPRDAYKQNPIKLICFLEEGLISPKSLAGWKRRVFVDIISFVPEIPIVPNGAEK